jgi:hypothetical protein
VRDRRRSSNIRANERECVRETRRNSKERRESALERGVNKKRGKNIYKVL